MIGKKKLMLLSAAAVLLALVYAGTFVFDRQHREIKRSSYLWISRNVLEQADWIEIGGMAGPVILKRANGVWVMPLFLGEGIPDPFRDFPVKQPRVDGLFGALSKRANYPVRSRSSGNSLRRLGLAEGDASRITIFGGAGLPLLDLMIGFGDAAGSTVYFRRAGSDEARSGEDIFSMYTEAGRRAWLDLSLFGNGQITPVVSLDMVQSAAVYPPGRNDSWILSRNGNGWTFAAQGGSSQSGSVSADRVRAESWLRSVLAAEADDFDYFSANAAPQFNSGSIILELGDGTSKIIRIGAEDENKSRPAITSGNEFVYELNERTLGRLFPDESSFFEEN